MKSKLLTIARLLNIYLVAALTLVYSSCSETELVDSTGFILQYYGVTDIGPSMTYTLEAPTYKGSTPYDFTITGVTLNEEAFENADYFVIDAETGAITIQNTESIPTGLYNISVGCYSNGKFYNFKDAVQVNMLLAVPDGVTVEPAEVLVNQDEENWAEASAQVTTEQDKHVSITGYSIVQDESKPYLAYFNIDGKGKITINPETKDKLIAGESYVLSLKLTTGAGEHMYADAVTFKVVSKPRDLVYSMGETDYDLFEEGSAGESNVPKLKGAKENLRFTIKSITPEVSGFTINEESGQIILPENHSIPANDNITYLFTITVSNSYGNVDFENIYAVKITDFVKPIVENSFSYAANIIYQLGGDLTAERNPGFEGDAVTFSFAEENTDDEIIAHYNKEIISIDPSNGTITISKDHTLNAGHHEIKVKATNMKNKDGVIKSLIINVLKNPNYFTYIDWGNNIENKAITIGSAVDQAIQQTQDGAYRNQFRYIRNRKIDAKISVCTHDLNTQGGSSLHFEIAERFPTYTDAGKQKFAKTTIDESTGEITLGEKPLGSVFDGGILLIKVTATHTDAPAFSRYIPIFFNGPKTAKNIPGTENGTSITPGQVAQTMLCTPFVVRVNPKDGTCSDFKSNIVGIDDDNKYTHILDLTKDKFVWGYAGTYAYLNFDDNETHLSTPENLSNSSSSNELLYQVWDNCNMKSKTDRTPMRYYDEQGASTINNGKKAGYLDVENGTPKLVIIPEKWKGADNKYAYGAMLSQIKYNTTSNKKEIGGSGSADSNPVYPLIIWFDETYEGN